MSKKPGIQTLPNWQCVYCQILVPLADNTCTTCKRVRGHDVPETVEVPPEVPPEVPVVPEPPVVPPAATVRYPKNTPITFDHKKGVVYHRKKPKKPRN